MIKSQFGPKLLPNGLTRFRLWAPDYSDEQRSSVAVQISGRAPVLMLPGEDGWVFADVECAPGARYRFRIPGEGGAPPQFIADPASRLQDGDVHDASIVVGPSQFVWHDTQWKGRPWSEAVIYELHVGLCGGFQGVKKKLQSIAQLGFTAVELMPIGDFPRLWNWGYDVALPYAPDTEYGSPDDLRELIDEAHRLRLMVFLDVVYNHFGSDGNFLHSVASSFFREDVQTPWGAAIDFRRPEVRAFFSENAHYWLEEFHFDGLRFDAAHQIGEQDWLVEIARSIRQSIGEQRHVHLVLEHEGNVAHWLGRDFDAQWNDDSHHVMHVLLTGESEGYYKNFTAHPSQMMARWLAEGFVYQGETFKSTGRPRGEHSAHLPASAFVNCLQNHDQIGNRALGERLTQLAEPQALRAAIALLLLCPQIPLVFMGEESGSASPFLFFASHNPELAELVREGRREEFAHFPAFADPAAREQIPDPNDIATFRSSIAEPDANAKEWNELYRRLLAARSRYLFGQTHSTTSLGSQVLGPKAATASWRLGDDRELILLTNLDQKSVKALPMGTLLHCEPPDAYAMLKSECRLPGYSTVALIGDNTGALSAPETARSNRLTVGVR